MSGENTSVSTQCSGQETTISTVSKENEYSQNDRILRTTQLLKGNRITKAKKYCKMKRMEGGTNIKDMVVYKCFVWEAEICFLQAPSTVSPHIFTVAAEQHFTKKT